MQRHCPDNLNPGNLPLRGKTATDFCNLFSEWNNGPTFLHQSINTWPVDISVTDLPISEDKKVLNVVESVSSQVIKNVIDIHKYSTADCLFRVTAFILRFISNLKLSVQRKETKKIYLAAEEIEIVEYTWIK